MNALTLFVHDMLVEAWFTEPQISDDLIDEVMEVLIDRIVTSIALKLTDDDKVTFLEMTENNQESQAFVFAQQQIPAYTYFMENVLYTFKLEYLRDMGK